MKDIAGSLTLLAVTFPVCSALASSDEGAASDTVLHAVSVEEIHYRSQTFDIAARLYLPKAGPGRIPAVMWVSGSGPSFRTVRQAESKRFFNCFLDCGFALLLIDKPGSGDTQGHVRDDSLFAQLSDVVADGVAMLRDHPKLDPAHIGLAGSSQAGYVMPLAVRKSQDVAFMIGFSCPGESSIEQWNFLLEQQMLCDGMSPDRARRSAGMFSVLRRTTDRERFDEAIAYFELHPLLVPSLGYDSAFSRKAREWWPRVMREHDEAHFDPMTVVARLRVPIFMAYGGRDTQVDVRQAMEAYSVACRSARNERLTMRLFQNSDHNMKLSGGCLNDIRRLNASGEYGYDHEVLATLRQWLTEVRSSVQR